MRETKTGQCAPAKPRLIWVVLLNLLLFLSGGYAADFTINGFSPSEGQIKGIVATDGTAWLTLKRTNPDPEVWSDVTVTLTEFRDTHGNVITVGFQKKNQQKAQLGSLVLEDTIEKDEFKARVTIKLDASAVVAGRQYGGEITVKPDGVNSGTASFDVFSILLERAASASLVYKVYQSDPSEQNAGSDNKSIAVNVPINGITSIQFAVDGDDYLEKTAVFKLGTFLSTTDGRAAYVYFKDPDEGGQKVLKLETPLDTPRLRLTLDASEIPVDADYVGELTVTVDDQEFSPRYLKLTRKTIERNAELVVGQPPHIEIRCWRLDCATDESVEVVLWEQSGKRPITGISLATTSSEGVEGYLDPLSYLDIKFLPPSHTESTVECVKPPMNLWLLDSGNIANLQRRSIAAGSQGKLKICVNNEKELSPGQYKIPFQVRALNVDSAKSAKLVLGLTIKHPPLYPFLVLLFSVLISYILTKIIRTQLQRIDLKKRISRISDANWFRKDWSIMPVVRTKALLAQVTKALDHRRVFKYLFFPSSLIEHVTAVEKRLPYLKRLCELIDYWEKAGHDELVRRRAKKVLWNVVDAFVDTPIYAELDATVVTQLTNLEEWKNPAKLVGHYWLSLKGDILQLQSQIRLSDYKFGVDFTRSDNTLAKLPASRIKQEFEKTSIALHNFQETMDTNLASEVKAVINDASNTLATIQSGSLETLVEAFKAIKKTLDEIEDNGPTPVLVAVKSASDHLRSSALTSGWPDLEKLRDLIEATPGLGDDQIRAELLSHLKTIARWNPDQLSTTLNTLQLDLNQSKHSDREVARGLLLELKPDDQPKNLKEMIEREISYAKLKVINRARENLRKRLLGAVRANKSLDDLFCIVDDEAWYKLQSSVSVEIESHQTAAFEPIYFHVRTKDEEVRDSYLYKHGAIYEWEIHYEPISHKENQVTRPLRATTDRPGVVQFIPVQTEKVHATVSIRYNGRDKKEKTIVKDIAIDVGKPTMFGIVAAFQLVELAALAIALAVAVTTGMESTEYENAQSGSLMAYTALFLWGFAADQIKNLLMNINTLMGTQG